jgi:hypothetical protein
MEHLSLAMEQEKNDQQVQWRRDKVQEPRFAEKNNI